MSLNSTQQAASVEAAQNEDILSQLEDAKIEWPKGSNKYFFPADCLETIVNRNSVRTELGNLFPRLDSRELNKHVDTIFNSTPAIGVFITVLRTRKTSILEILDEGLTDLDLPLERHQLTTYPDDDNPPFVLFCSKDHTKHCVDKGEYHTTCKITSVLAMSNWPRKQIEKFDAIQWRVKAPVFQKSQQGKIQHINLHKNIVMPYVKDYRLERQPDAGGYSEVWAVIIHPANQSVYKRGGRQNDRPKIAVKRLHSQNETEFENERKMLQYLALKGHQNLVKLLATYTQDRYHHLLFPFADANLRGYWEQVKIPPRELDTYRWCLDQLIGLVSGLDIIHNFQTSKVGVKLGTDTGNDGLSRIRPSGMASFNLVVQNGEEIFGRHGDLKPENILWFNETDDPTKQGILQITDLGLGRFHGFGSKSKDDPRKLAGSATYVPPEMALNKPISRAYDIWSLGCVFLEFFTWMVKGCKAVKEFSDARLLKTEDGVEDDTFFTRTGEHAVVRDGVINWVERLRQHPRCSKMIHDLLDITMNKMLRVAVGERIVSRELHTELKKVHSKATKDTELSTLEFILGRKSQDIAKSDESDSNSYLNDAVPGQA